MLVEITNPDAIKKVTFSSAEEETLCKIAAGDIVAKLELVKTCMDLVVKFANWYALENERVFPQLIQTGICAVIKAAQTFPDSRHRNFTDHASQEIVKAMTEMSRLNL